MIGSAIKYLLGDIEIVPNEERLARLVDAGLEALPFGEFLRDTPAGLGERDDMDFAIILRVDVRVFSHPDPINFGTWAGVTSTVTCAYHWLVIRDAKEKDAC